MLSDLVAAGDTDINATLADESGDIGSGQEDQGNRKVLDESNIEAGFAAELNVSAGEKVEGCLLETALWFALVIGFVGWWMSASRDYG